MLIAAACAPNGGTVITNFRCPVDGSRYTDDYGPRGSGFHYGIDMLAPTGTPTWAVKSGGVYYTLESAGEAHARASMGAVGGEVAPLEEHLSVLQRGEATDGVEQGGLPRSIGTDDRDDLAGVDPAGDPVDGLDPAVADPDLAGLKQEHCGGPRGRR